MAYFVPAHVGSLHRATRTDMNRANNSFSYAYKTAQNRSEEPIIPDPELFHFQPPSDSHSAALKSDLPTVSQCAVHLELLEVFHTLRQKILQSTELDASFDILPHPRTVYRKGYSSAKRKYEISTYTAKDTTFESRREEKWPYFLELAVGRFVKWIRDVDRMSFWNGSEGARPGLRLLPPVDVLMVWHAFLLNPTDFDFYCVKHGLQRMRKASLPWREIHEAIDSRDWSYNLPKSHKTWLTNQIQLAPDLFETLIEINKQDHVKTVLLEFRSGLKQISFSRERMGTRRNIAFAELVQTTRTNAKENEPLVENVQRQTKFIHKMHTYLWIRSPAVEGTVRRAIGRYEKFLQLFLEYPDSTMVPTLDVDLVWHTHLCDPEQYRASLLQRAGRMVNHDDKLGKSFLDDRFDKTGELFRVAFGLQYHVCLCWDCEAVASAMEAIAKNDDVDILDDFETEAESVANKVEEDVRYYRAVEISRQKGMALPLR
ncbi:hypothetical protein BDV28DRAFT_136029 [Aspergillus coremiiformis]|uniref:Uncharacterized protein n=1 Tax=Aspergillus coremiiformis TaxID=138285 RepID=A0A5N6Z3H4_9EURO|nr:hypothetical protein BDV28DRAFT_136029 [Aspergillus coremiiformis]